MPHKTTTKMEVIDFLKASEQAVLASKAVALRAYKDHVAMLEDDLLDVTVGMIMYVTFTRPYGEVATLQEAAEIAFGEDWEEKSIGGFINGIPRNPRTLAEDFELSGSNSLVRQKLAYAYVALLRREDRVYLLLYDEIIEAQGDLMGVAEQLLKWDVPIPGNPD